MRKEIGGSGKWIREIEKPFSPGHDHNRPACDTLPHHLATTEQQAWDK